MKRLIGIPLSIAAASAVAMANFTLTFTSSASDTWQLVGAGQGMDISTLVGTSVSPGSAASVIESAWYYDDATLTWKVAANTFNPAQVGYTLLTATNPYDGVWMRVKGGSSASAAVSTTTDGTQSSFTVTSGWNLRGVSETISTTSASQLVKYPFLNDKTNGILVYTYNIASNVFEVFSPNGFATTPANTFSTISQYEGFWIKVSNTKTYAISDAAAGVTASLPVTDGIIGDPGSLISTISLADSVINNFSTLLKFGPQSRLSLASITSFSGDASTAATDLNTTTRNASNQVVVVRDSVGAAKASVEQLVQQLSITGFVSVTNISAPVAQVQALVDDLNSSIYTVSGVQGQNSDYNLTEANASAVLAVDGNATDTTLVYSASPEFGGFAQYLQDYPSSANATVLDPILLLAVKTRDKVSALKSHLVALSTTFSDLNTTMKDLNTSIDTAANGSDVNATVTIVASDVNETSEVVKELMLQLGDDISSAEINGTHSLLLTYSPNGGGTPSSLTFDFNNTATGTTVGDAYSALGYSAGIDNNVTILNIIKKAVETDATMNAAMTLVIDSAAAEEGNMSMIGKAGAGNFGVSVTHSTISGPSSAGEANVTTLTSYEAAVTGVSQTTQLSFDGTFRGGDVIELNITGIEDHSADDHYTGGIMDNNVSLVLTADSTGAQVAALLKAEIAVDVPKGKTNSGTGGTHGFGLATSDTTGSISGGDGTVNTLTLDANDTFKGTGYTLLLTVNGNSGLTALATQANLTATAIYAATNDYAVLNQATGSTSIVSWDANASNFHQAVESKRFTTLSVDGNVYLDSASRLVWDVAEQSSLSSCASSNRYNINSWALPTITELLSLYDASTNVMSLTWLNALTFTGPSFTITPSTATNLDKLFFVSKDGNVSNSSITVETERRVLGASGMTVREYNSTDTTVHMSAHCVAQQTSTTDFDEYYSTTRFGTSNNKTAITSDISALTDADKRVTDAALSIEWERKVTVTSTASPFDSFENANYYCAVLNHGGQTDWRLPTIEELTSLNLFDIEARYNLSQSSTGLNRSTLFLYDFNDSSSYWSSDVNGTDSYKVINPVADVSYTNMFAGTSPSTGATNTRAICVRNQ